MPAGLPERAEHKDTGAENADTAFYDRFRSSDNGSGNGTDSSRSADFFEASATVPGSDPRTDKAEERTAEEKEKNDRLLSDIRYPGAMDYSRPTERALTTAADSSKTAKRTSGILRSPKRRVSSAGCSARKKNRTGRSNPREVFLQGTPQYVLQKNRG